MGFLTDEQVLSASPRALETWADIQGALEREGIDSLRTEIAALATVAVETGNSFLPIAEKGSMEYFERYDGNKQLGNTVAGDGYRFRGRGFVQITGRWNYEFFGRLVQQDLLSNPDLALDTQIAARILAIFFKVRHLNTLADQGDWLTVRRRVNGGVNGLDRYFEIVKSLAVDGK